jgi:hypothetical protein
LGFLRLLNQTILVTTRRDQYSIVSIVCDPPSVTVRQTPSSGAGKTIQIDVSLNPDRLEKDRAAPSSSRPSDAELPELRIPIQGAVR